MSADRELLKQAAKAAGIALVWDEGHDVPRHAGVTGNSPRIWWNPLNEDGDALRLAVKLGLQVVAYPMYDEPKHSVIVRKPIWNHDTQEGDGVEDVELYGADPDAATRRAIVRAAAEIGRRMP